jgi:hypothetical protein
VHTFIKKYNLKCNNINILHYFSPVYFPVAMGYGAGGKKRWQRKPLHNRDEGI